MVTTGGSISGYSRRGSRPKETRPKTINSSDITAANTGRFTETSDRIIGPRLSVPWVNSRASDSLPVSVAMTLTACPGRVRKVPSTTTNSPVLRPSSISTSPGLRLPMVTWRRRATVDAAERSTTSTWLSRPEGISASSGITTTCPRIFQQLDLHQQTRFQQTLRVGQNRSGDNRSGDRIDSAADAGNGSREGAPGECRRSGRYGQPCFQAGQVNRGYREIKLHDAVVVQGGDQITRLDERAHADVAKADNACKRGDDQAVLQL
jgi:hypothetical protein